MKNLLIIVVLVISLFSCVEKKEQNVVGSVEKVLEIKETPSNLGEEQTEIEFSESDQDTYAKETEITTEETEIDITVNDSINFGKYAVEVQEFESKAPLDFGSYPESKSFKTRITEAYSDGTVIDFGGHYIVSAFGCGAGCIMGFMVDVRDGKIYDLPLGEQNSCFWSLDRALGKADSRLFISAICKEEENSETALYIAYIWNEEKKLFENVNKEEFIIKK